MRGRITRRTVLASGALAAVVGTAFGVVRFEIQEMRQADRLARHSERVLSAANQLERFVIDLETGLRGFALSGEERFLQPLNDARRAFPGAAETLERLANGTKAGPAGQTERALRIGAAGNAYIRDYVDPTLQAVRRDLAALPVESGLLVPSPQTVAAFEEGKHRVDALRAEFDGFATAERGLAAARDSHSTEAAGRAILAATTGVGASVALVALFAVYLTRAIVAPVRRAAAMAGQLAAGDLSVRMPATGPGEVGELERAFNTMAAALRQLLDEQAALRRVATLVARGVPPTEVFDAVVREAHAGLDPSHTFLARYEVDGTTTVLANSPDLRDQMPADRRFRPEDQTVAAEVFRTGRPARLDVAGEALRTDSALRWVPALRCAVAAPVVVEGRLWGTMVAAWAGSEAPSADVEDRLGNFTELIGTAIANAESREELVASRARVVAAGDEARRRIERDLHDGIQQRLVALALDLRALEATASAEDEHHRLQLEKVVQTLSEAIEELREVSRGIHPAILARGGLSTALNTLARRSTVPVRLQVAVADRLPASVEVAVYYVVTEALTNAAKHARASVVQVGVHVDDGCVWLSIRDDGIGGADSVRGSGLVGLRDRIEAIDGSIDVTSPPGAGTTYLVKIPVGRTR